MANHRWTPYPAPAGDLCKNCGINRSAFKQRRTRGHVASLGCMPKDCADCTKLEYACPRHRKVAWLDGLGRNLGD